MSGRWHAADGGEPSALDVLATLERALSGEASLDELVVPLLAQVAALTGLEVVFVTEVFHDVPVVAQEVLLVLGPGAALDVERGAVVSWPDALCRRCMHTADGVLTDVGTGWRGAPAPASIATYVSVPIRAPGASRVRATLCAASATRVALDERQLGALRLVARLVGAVLWQQRGDRVGLERAEDAEKRLAERLAFDAKVQHALRTPLSVLRGWAVTLRDEMVEDPRLRREGLDVIERTADRMLRQVGELLREDRILAGRDAPVDVDLRAVVDDALALLGARPVAVTGAATLLGDPAAVAVVVEHLLENVAAHTPEDTQVRITIDHAPDGPPAVVLVVEDDGPGLPDRDDLFDAFVSADPTATRHGSGLGLHIIRELVERWGGSIAAGAAASGGARFEVRLPVRPPPVGPAPLPGIDAVAVPRGGAEP